MFIFTDTKKLGRLLIIAVILSYVIMLFGGGILKPNYSHVSQYISELNATGTPFASTIGWLGFVPFGLLSAMLLVVMLNHAPVVGASRVGMWLLFAEPVAYIGSTLVPCDVGCPSQGSINQVLHNFLGLLTYLSTTLGLVLLSFTPMISIGKRVFWVFCALVWFLLFALMIDGAYEAIRGGLQRLAEWLVYSALLVAAWNILSANKLIQSTAHASTD